MTKFLWTLFFLVGTSVSTFGQPPPPPPPNPAISFDVLVALLLLSAVIYAVNDLRLKKVKSS